MARRFERIVLTTGEKTEGCERRRQARGSVKVRRPRDARTGPCADAIGSRWSNGSTISSAVRNSARASLQTEMLPRNPLDDKGHVVVVRNEDAVDRQDAQRHAAEHTERSRRSFDVSVLRIFAMLHGGLDQRDEHG